MIATLFTTARHEATLQGQHKEITMLNGLRHVNTDAISQVESRVVRLPSVASFETFWFTERPNRRSHSDLSHSAVDVDFHARDVRRILRSQKRHGTCHFLGLSEPLHGNFRDYFFGEFIGGLLG